MNFIRRLARAVLLVSGISLAAPGLVVTDASAAPDSDDLILATAVLRGSTPDPAPPSPAAGDAPVVLRGSPSSPVRPPAAAYACPSGYNYDPTYGCVLPGYAYTPDDYGYWPYYGFDGFSSGAGQRRFRNRFPQSIGHGSAVRFGRRPLIGLGHGFAHAAGFGHR
jgi:hypothetical protein